MRVLSFDPGAERMGWASIEADDTGLHYHMSGLIPIPRGKMKPQEYKLDLIATVAYWTPTLFDLTEPDAVVSETVPSVGGGNFIAAAQSYMANTAIVTVQAIAFTGGYPVFQIAANSVQSKIAIGRTGRKVTKVQVRNGVIKLFPELEDRKRDWVKVFEEPDAIAIGAAHLGADNTK
jgi:Holliday junction resolvasome RuvABC endonuclease subunit